MNKDTCPICKEMQHLDKRYEIEQFLSRTEKEVTYQSLADEMLISKTEARRYLVKLIDLGLVKRFKVGNKLVFVFKHEQLLEE